MSALPCTKCRTPLPPLQANTGHFDPCPGCGLATRLEVFPALLHPVQTGASPEPVLVEHEAGCFYHPQKRAATHCESCGRFLCALCDVDLNGRHLCPGCLNAGQRKGSLTELENRRVLYDSAALSLAVVPLLIWPLTLLTGPIAAGVAVYGWNKPGSLVPRTKARAVAAILLGLAEVIGCSFFFYTVFTSH